MKRIVKLIKNAVAELIVIIIASPGESVVTSFPILVTITYLIYLLNNPFSWTIISSIEIIALFEYWSVFCIISISQEQTFLYGFVKIAAVTAELMLCQIESAS